MHSLLDVQRGLLENGVTKKIDNYIGVINGLLDVIGTRDSYTRAHSQSGLMYRILILVTQLFPIHIVISFPKNII